MEDEEKPEEEGIELAPEAIVRLYSAFGIRRCWQNKKGRFHRLNGPAIILNDGFMWWIRHGKRHRDDGPAIEWPSENKSVWYKDGVKYEPSAHELIAWKMKKKEK